jgi:uncharacterized membrane protein YoaK (UPF0700 family)
MPAFAGMTGCHARSHGGRPSLAFTELAQEGFGAHILVDADKSGHRAALRKAARLLLCLLWISRTSRSAIMADERVNPTAATDRSQPPAPSPRAQERNAERLAATLALIAGFVDAYGMITYGVYVSFMSGNTTQTGYQAAEGAFGPASLSALAILFFVVGAFAGTLIVEFSGRYSRRVLYCVVAGALAALVGLTQFGMLPATFAIAAISVAMGVMNNALSRVGAQAVSLTFVTGSLSRVGSSLALALRRAPLRDAQGPWDTHLRRALLLARLWLGFLVGAFLSGAGTPRYGALVLSAPALILAILAALDRPDPARGLSAPF